MWRPRGLARRSVTTLAIHALGQPLQVARLHTASLSPARSHERPGYLGDAALARCFLPWWSLIGCLDCCYRTAPKTITTSRTFPHLACSTLHFLSTFQSLQLSHCATLEKILFLRSHDSRLPLSHRTIRGRARKPSRLSPRLLLSACLSRVVASRAPCPRALQNWVTR
jgi:hypothetical protein